MNLLIGLSAAALSFCCACSPSNAGPAAPVAIITSSAAETVDLPMRTLNAAVVAMGSTYRQSSSEILGALLVTEESLRSAGVTEDTLVTALSLNVPPALGEKVDAYKALAFYVNCRKKGIDASQSQRALALCIQEASLGVDPMGLLASR